MSARHPYYEAMQALLWRPGVGEQALGRVSQVRAPWNKAEVILTSEAG